jgi:D-serine deaminase-like pyridoxal phosphate-dependent protein
MLDPESRRRRYDAAFAELPAPFAFVDLDAMWANSDEMLARAAGKPIRIASKSLRCRALLRTILDRERGYRGLLAFTLPEALWLASEGFADLVVAYPTTDRRALRELAAVTDEQLAAEIRAAAAVVMARVDQLAAGGTWPIAGHDKATHATLRAAAEQLVALPADAAAVDVRAAVAPMLGLFWPASPAAMRPAHDAIEDLRQVAMHWWAQVRDARWVTDTGPAS